MSRIRSIKPGFWTSQTLARVSRDARLAFAGLFNEADDEGRLADAPKRLAGALFPFDDDVTAAWFDARLAELVKVGAIIRYVVDGARFIAVPGFDRHQRINRPTPSTIPPPPGESSLRTHGALTDDSVQDGNGLEEEWNGMEREGKGLEGRATAPAALAPTKPVQQIHPDRPEPLGPYGEVMPKTVDAVLDYVHERKTLRERWESEHPELGPIGVKRGVEAAMAHRMSLDGPMFKRWFWPNAFVGKVDTWLAKNKLEALRTIAAQGFAAKSGAPVPTAPVQTQAQRNAAHLLKIAAHQAAKVAVAKPVQSGSTIVGRPESSTVGRSADDLMDHSAGGAA